MDSFDLKLEDLRETFSDKSLLPVSEAMKVRNILKDASRETLRFFAEANVNFISQVASRILEERV